METEHRSTIENMKTTVEKPCSTRRKKASRKGASLIAFAYPELLL
jgi:hypothetical protein